MIDVAQAPVVEGVPAPMAEDDAPVVEQDALMAEEDGAPIEEEGPFVDEHGAPLIQLQTSGENGKIFRVTEKVAKISVTIKNLLEDVDDEPLPIPIQNIEPHVLQMVIEYCKHHQDDEPPKEEEAISDKRLEPIAGWDKEFCQVDQATLFHTILAANFLDIKPLLDLTCKRVAEMIRGKSPEEIRKQFNIKNDFTPEEEERIKKENEWCEEP
eukprot:m.163489 g.163489  ORF g.163489 m.163489 type:complete len:212 (-) comp14638_c0_seq3:80-715(-)